MDKQTRKDNAKINTYSTLINELNGLQVATRLSEKKAAVVHLAKFLHSEGYVQLAEAIETKATELIRKEYL